MADRKPLLITSLFGLLVATITISMFFGVPQAGAVPIDVDDGGEFGPVEEWPLVAIHSNLSPDGEVLTYGTNADGTQTGRFIYDVWTPNNLAASGHTTLDNSTQTDLFCSLQINRADTGEVLLFGGDTWNGTSTTGIGNNDINSFNPSDNSLTPLPGMNRGRWYGTGTTRPDGSIYVQGGTGGGDFPELWTPEEGATLLPIATSALSDFYPRNFVLSDGRIFGIDARGQMYSVSQDLSSLTRLGNLSTPSHGNSVATVMFEPDKILYFGGDSTDAWIVDMSNGRSTPSITRTGSMSDSNRAWVNGTILPDGRVLATGGAEKPSHIFFNDPLVSYDVAYAAEIWDPQTGQWTVGDSAAQARLYHSTALLLADGRVLTAGGGAPGPVTQTTAEIYSPDYLRRADGTPTPRLSLNSVSPSNVQTADSVTLSVSNGADVERVTLVKTGSVTHSFDNDQRFIEMPFTTSGNSIAISMPSSSGVLTPGYYHVFVLDENDIPSPSKLLRVIPGEVAPPQPNDPATLGDQISYDDGSPASNVAVDLFEANADGSRGTYLESTTSDSDGKWSFSVAPGCYVVTVIAPADTNFLGGGQYQNTGRCVEAGEVDNTLDAVLVPEDANSLGTIGDSVTRVDGSSVEGVAVDLFTSNPSGERLSYLRTTLTDDAGNYAFSVEDGCYAVTFIAPAGERFINGTEWSDAAACVSNRGTVDSLDAVLNNVDGGGEGDTISGTISNADGIGQSGVVVDLFNANADGSRGSYLTSATTNSSGNYSFARPQGCYVTTMIAPAGQRFSNGSQWSQESFCAGPNQPATIDAVLE